MTGVHRSPLSSPPQRPKRDVARIAIMNLAADVLQNLCKLQVLKVHIVHAPSAMISVQYKSDTIVLPDHLLNFKLILKLDID